MQRPFAVRPLRDYRMGRMTHSAFPPRLFRTCGALVVACGVIMGALTAHLPEIAFVTGGPTMVHRSMEMQTRQGPALVRLVLGAGPLSSRLPPTGSAGSSSRSSMSLRAVSSFAFSPLPPPPCLSPFLSPFLSLFLITLPPSLSSRSHTYLSSSSKC